MFSIDKKELVTDFNSCSNISRKSTESEIDLNNKEDNFVIKLCKKEILEKIKINKNLKKKKFKKKKICKKKNRVEIKKNNFDEKFFFYS